MRILLLSFAILLLGGLHAQELTRSVVGSAGSYFSAINVGNLHWTVGEIAVERTQNGLVLERGFHHGNYELLSTAVWTAPEVELAIKVYPNPTVDQVTLEGDWETGDRLEVRDFLGRRLKDQALPPVQAEVKLLPFPAGTYLLTITRQGRPLTSMRIVRQ